MGTPLGPKYIPYTYMDPLGKASIHGAGAGHGSGTRLGQPHFVAAPILADLGLISRLVGTGRPTDPRGSPANDHIQTDYLRGFYMEAIRNKQSLM